MRTSPFLEQAHGVGGREVEQRVDQTSTGEETQVAVVLHFENRARSDLSPHVLSSREGRKEGGREGGREGGKEGRMRKWPAGEETQVAEVLHFGPHVLSRREEGKEGGVRRWPAGEETVRMREWYFAHRMWPGGREGWREGRKVPSSVS